MAKWEWAALWKRAAKRHKRFDKYLYKSLIRTRIKYRDAWRWARTWKRAAKNYRAVFRLYMFTSVPLWEHWETRRWAGAWKAAAKKWRRKALKEE